MSKVIFISFSMFFLVTTCFAQGDSKVFFFRNDYSFPREILHVGYRLHIDGKIHKMHNHSVYIANENSPAGYLNLSWISWPYNYRKFPFPKIAPKNTITFVEIKRKHLYFTNNIVMKEIPLEKINESYAQVKWFKKMIRRSGYQSINELIERNKVTNR